MKDGITIAIENPESEDAVQLMEELSACLQSLTGDSGKASFDVRDLHAPRSAFVIARDSGGKAVGCGAIRPIDGQTAEVKRMYCRISGQGMGKRILSFLEEHAGKLTYSALRLETRRMNKAAVAFYISCGYHEIPNYGKYAGRAEAICFEKKL